MPGIFVRNVHPSSCALNYSQWNSVIIPPSTLKKQPRQQCARAHRGANNGAISMKWNHRHLSQFTTYKKNRGNSPPPQPHRALRDTFALPQLWMHFLDALLVLLPFRACDDHGKSEQSRIRTISPNHLRRRPPFERRRKKVRT